MNTKVEVLSTIVAMATVAMVLTAPINSDMATPIKDNEALMPIAFRKKGNSMGSLLKCNNESYISSGYLASGLTYAHIHLPIHMDSVLDTFKHTTQAVSNAWSETIKSDGTGRKQFGFMFEGLNNSAEVSVRMIQNIKMMFFNAPDEAKRRTPRQALSIAGAVGAVIDLGLSLYNLHEIKELHQEMQKAKNERIQIIEMVKTEATRINQISKYVEGFHEEFKNLAQRMIRQEKDTRILTIYNRLSAMYAAYNMDMALFYQALRLLLSGHLEPYLVLNQGVVDALSSVATQAAKKGLVPFYNEPSGFFQADVSYLVDNKTIHVYVHIPLYEPDPLALYEYVKAPIILPHHQSSVPLMFVDTQNTALAISEVTNNGIEVDMVQLASCPTKKNHLGYIYLCPQTNLMAKDVTKTCLGVLHSGRYNVADIRKHCRVYFKDEDEFAAQISPNLFVYFTKVESKITLKCPDKNEDMLVVGMNKLLVPSQCQMVTSAHIFKAHESLSIDEDLVYLPKKLNFDELDIPIQALKHLKNTYKSYDIKLPDRIDIDRIDALLAEAKESFTGSGLTTFWLTLWLSVITMVLLRVVIFLGYHQVLIVIRRRIGRMFNQAPRLEEEEMGPLRRVNPPPY